MLLQTCEHPVTFMLYSEPISGTAPKVPFVQQFVRNTIAVAQSLAILCPAQAYPVPNFRYELSSRTAHKIAHKH